MTSMTGREAVERGFASLWPSARRESSERPRVAMMLDFIVRHAGGITGKRVLELGSSVGVNLVAMKMLGASSAVGMDKFIFPDEPKNAFSFSEAEFSVLRQAWASAGVETRKGDLADTFPFADGSVDLVVSNAVLEHCNGIHKHVFAEVRRVLAPGGIFAFTTPNLASLLKRARFALGRSPNWDMKDYFDSATAFTGHVREFTVSECRAMLAWSGFSPIAVTSATSYWSWRWLTRANKIGRVPFQLLARLRPTWGDLVFAVGRKGT